MATHWADNKRLGKAYDGQGIAADGSTLRFDRGAGRPCEVPGCDHNATKKEEPDGTAD